MKICLIGFHQYPIPPLQGGSLAVVAYELIREFAKKGHSVSVFSVSDPLLPDYEEQQRIRYLRIPKSVFQGNNILEQTISSISYSFLSSKKMKSIRSFDVIQCFDPFLLPFLKWFNIFKKKPTILRFGMGFGLSKGWNLFKRPNWAFLKLADRIIVPSYFLKKCIVTNLKLSDKQVSVIPNGVNLIRFNPEIQGNEVRCKYGLGDSPVILFVGRVCPEKGVDLLLKSIPFIQKRIKDVKLLIVGPQDDNNYKERLKSLIVKLNLCNVYFTGAVDVIKDLPKIYAACDVFCCPSIQGEAFGLVVIEAMASGKPVVVTRSGGIPEIVTDGKVGYIVARKRKKELARALIEILEKEDLKEIMGLNARKRVEESFSWNTASKRYLEIYEELINRN